jgi:hypothetical protein
LSYNPRDFTFGVVAKEANIQAQKIGVATEAQRRRVINPKPERERRRNLTGNSIAEASPAVYY